MQLTQLDLTSAFGLPLNCSLCSTNQLRQDKLIIFFLISARRQFSRTINSCLREFAMKSEARFILEVTKPMQLHCTQCVLHTALYCTCLYCNVSRHRLHSSTSDYIALKSFAVRHNLLWGILGVVQMIAYFGSAVDQNAFKMQNSGCNAACIRFSRVEMGRVVRCVAAAVDKIDGSGYSPPSKSTPRNPRSGQNCPQNAEKSES